jgi:hypothetical protein
MTADETVSLQETLGYQLLAKGEALPLEIDAGNYYTVGGQYPLRLSHGKSILEAQGVMFLGNLEGEPFLQQVELPTGWTLRVAITDPTPWLWELTDDKGRVRASVSYHENWEGRHANVGLLTRFLVSNLGYDEEQKANAAIAVVLDCGKVVQTFKVPFPPRHLASPSPAHERAWGEARDAARRWLNEHYPGWNNPGKHWD